MPMPSSPAAPTPLLLSQWEPRRQVRVARTSVPTPAHPVVDAHNHLGRWLCDDGAWMAPDVGALLALMDRARVRTVVNLDGRPHELEENLDRYDRAHPGRFVTFAQVDFDLLAGPHPTRRLVAQVRDAARLGARGLKVWKDLGLERRDASGALVLPDDPRVAPVFAIAGELGLPVTMHTADPIAFFEPLDRHNERIDELAEMPQWWWGGEGMPSFDRLLDCFEAVVAAHPGTVFVGAHVGCAAEDLGRVGRMLSAYPNLHVDIGGRLGELGRQPRAARDLILRHPDRVLFGTDCFPLDEANLTLHYRFLETADECFSYAPDCAVPPQGRWDVSALDLPVDVLEQVYAANAVRVLGLG